jgi:hypothetical protein
LRGRHRTIAQRQASLIRNDQDLEPVDGCLPDFFWDAGMPPRPIIRVFRLPLSGFGFYERRVLVLLAGAREFLETKLCGTD